MLAGPGAITSVMVLVGQAQTALADGGDPGVDCDYGGDLLSGAGELGPGGAGDGGDGDSDTGADYGAAAGGAGGAVFREWDGGSGCDCEALGALQLNCWLREVPTVLKSRAGGGGDEACGADGEAEEEVCAVAGEESDGREDDGDLEEGFAQIVAGGLASACSTSFSNRGLCPALRRVRASTCRCGSCILSSCRGGSGIDGGLEVRADRR